MSNITKASVPGSRQRWGGLSLNKGSSLRGLFLAAVSGLFLTSALAADPNLTGPTTVVEDVAFDGGATPTRLVTNQLNLAWDKGGSNNIVQFRIFVARRRALVIFSLVQQLSRQLILMQLRMRTATAKATLSRLTATIFGCVCIGSTRVVLDR